MHVCLVTSRLPPTRCGVGDYTARLATELSSRGLKVTILTGAGQTAKLANPRIEVRNSIPSWGLGGALVLLRELKHLQPDLTILQWVPFLYHRYGINFALPLAALWLRGSGARLHLMVHEPWVPLDRPAFWITGPPQRLSLFLLAIASREIGVSIERWTELLRRLLPWKRARITWQPVGSNIPYLRVDATDRQLIRRRWNVPEASSVVAVFSPLASGMDTSLIESAWREIQARDSSSRLVLIGAPAETLRARVPSLVNDPGCTVVDYLPGDAVSACLQAADVLLAPFVDGISTRRTSVISAMAHALPIVTTRGPLTESEFFYAGPVILREPTGAALGEAVAALCRDREARSRIGKETLRFYQEHFSWDKIGSRLLSTIPTAAAQAEPPREAK